MMFWYGNGMNAWGYTLMTISMVLFWGLLIFGLIALVRYVARGEQRSNSVAALQLTPEEVLAERFARGEIDEDEYHERRGVLSGGHRATIKA